jgi:hypothetical protein
MGERESVEVLKRVAVVRSELKAPEVTLLDAG